MLDLVMRTQPTLPPAVRSHPAGALGELAESIGDVSDTHALVIGEHTLEMVCLLIRHGCIAAGTLRWHEKAECGAVDLVVVPDLPDLQLLNEALRQARRALLPNGRIVLHLAPERPSAVAGLIFELLERHGFCAMRVMPQRDGSLIEAEVPFFGPSLHHQYPHH